MLSANYHREQARVLAALALSSKNPFQASLFTQAAREHLEQAQAPSDDGVRSDAAPDGWSGALIRSRKNYSKRLVSFLIGSMSDCALNGFVRNAMHPESNAALRTAGSSFPVM